MRAATIRDGAIVVDDHPDPTPGAGEVLVRVRAAGLNGADMIQVAGGYPPPPGIPADIPGLELAGEVVALGPGRDALRRGRPRDGHRRRRGQAELARSTSASSCRSPTCSAGSGGRRARDVHDRPRRALHTGATCGPGERLLVSGAAGGVGTAGVQLGRAAGARVTATVRNHDHHAAIAELGAELVLDPEGFEEHGPFDVVLELVGAPNIPGNLKALATTGRIAVIGVGAGVKAELDLRRSCGPAGGSWPRACGPAAGGEGAHRAAPRAPRAAAVRERAR